MSSIGERIEILINILDMNRTEFGESVKVTQSYISKLIKKGGNPSDMFIDSVCKNHNVSEHWLRTGEGEMFIVPPDQDETAVYVYSLLQENNPLNDYIIEIMRTFRQLSPKSQDALLEFIDKFTENIADKRKQGD